MGDQNIYGAVPASFANPLLNIEPDTRVSDSLPRTTLAQRKHQLQQLVAQQQNPIFSLNTNNSNQSKDYINTSVLNKTADKQGIYQKSLNLLTNGVSPLLKKKSQQTTTQPNHYETFNLPKNLVTAKPAAVINSTNQNNSAVQSAIAASQISHLLSSPTSPVNNSPTIVGSNSLSSNLSAQLNNPNLNKGTNNRLSTTADAILINSPTSTSLTLQNHQQQSNQANKFLINQDNGNLDQRRKSELIMLSLDATTNEFDRLQQRQELMLENLDLGFETMLMNGNTVVSNNQKNQQLNQANQSNGNQQHQLNNMLQMHHLLMQQQHNNQQSQQQQQHLNGNTTNVLVSNAGDYGRTIQQSKLLNHPSVQTNNNNLMQQQQLQAQSNFSPHNQIASSANKPPLHPSQQHIYKEPMYLMYDDPNSNQQTQNVNTQLLQQQQQLNQQHKSSKNDENIYEEVDFMSLSSLRAQYADTLSLQSWKKKGSSKRGLSSTTSSSFTRWFSTRKKNSPSNSTTISNTVSNSNSHTDLDESTYFEVKQSNGQLMNANQALTAISKMQRQPICLPELPPQMNLTPEKLKRRMIVGSIVESENSYINSLNRLINDFKKPLEESSPPILSQNKIAIIFYRLEQILQCHSIFGIALNQCVRQWDVQESLGQVFITSFSKYMVLEIYSQFINNFTNAMETLRKASKSKSQFAQFLQEKTASSPDRLRPVQRFPQFILLLDDLLKHTPPDHHDRMTLQLALTQLESLADRLNERKRDSERHFAVKQLLKDYLSNSTTSSSNRYLLRMDDVYVLDLDPTTNLVLKSKCRKLYLLNDMLVCVSIPSNRLKFVVNLTDVDVIDDVTPASNNVLANTALRTKDSTSNSTSPQHCTVQRMYCDLNNLMHDLETISRISNLICGLRFNYNGLSIELTEQIAHEIRNEVRRKDAQITLIDRSCFQLRIRSKNYKDLICVQMPDVEIKKDWLTDVRIAKLALDRENNPAWSVSPSENHLSNSSVNINGMTQQRVPLFVKSLAIFATTETSQLTCALFYKLPYQPLNPIQQAMQNSGNSNQPILPLYSNQANSGGVLWICNVNQSGSQLGALATNGDDVNLIHSYELCDSHVSCLEHVDCYSVWIGLKQGRVIVIDAHSPSEWQQMAALEVAGEVVCMKHVGKFVYVGLKTGVLTLFDISITDYEDPIIITLSQEPVTCLLQINNEVYACSGDKIWVINENQQVERSYTLSGSQGPNKTDNILAEGLRAGNADSKQPNSTDLNDEQLTGNDDCDILSDQRPNLLAHCGIGLWVSLIDSPIIKLYHTETFKHLHDINVASNVKRVLQEDVPITVTSMLATRGLLWIGTSVGIIVTLTLPRLQGVPLVSNSLNVSLHRHLGPVTILLNLTPGAAPQSNLNKTSGRNGLNGNKSRRDSYESKSAEAESIYGLYADLMKIDDYMSEPRSTTASTASTAIATSITGGSNSAISNNPTGQQQMNNLHQIQQQQKAKLNGANNSVANRMAWDLGNMAISDDSTSESASSSAIYHDGMRQNLDAINQQHQMANISQNPNPLGNADLNANKANKTDSIGRSTAANNNSIQNIYEPKRPRSAQSQTQQMQNGFQQTANNYNNSTASNSNIRAQSTTNNSTGRPNSVNNGCGTNSNSIYESNVNFGNGNQPYYNNNESSSNLKTALLITGGNGFKQFNQSKPSFTSLHAHCIVWESKL